MLLQILNIFKLIPAKQIIKLQGALVVYIPVKNNIQLITNSNKL